MTRTLTPLKGKARESTKAGTKGYYKGYGKDKGKGKGKPKGYGKDQRSMSSMDGGKFATISEEDIDWGYDDQWGNSSQDAWNVSSVAKNQENDAPWNAGPDFSWAQSAEGSAWYTNGVRLHRREAKQGSTSDQEHEPRQHEHTARTGHS